MAYYTRYSRAQHYSSDKKGAWIYAQKLRCDLDVYDAQSRTIVWGTFQLCGNDGEVLGYAKSSAALRPAFAAHRPESWSLNHYDWTSKTWTSVKHS